MAHDRGDTVESVSSDLVDTVDQVKVVRHLLERRNKGTSARQGSVTNTAWESSKDPFTKQQSSELAVGQHYRPLDSKKYEIRLVHLLPGTFDDLIECKLVHTFLGDSQETYSAISYVWGDLSPRALVRLEGNDFTVTLNLALALRHLRDTTKTIALWIDALSINQADLQERNDQVSIMRNIYRCARSTYVWLGPATASSRVAFVLLHDLRKQLLDQSQFDAIIKDPHRSNQFEAILELWGRDYWWRVWVVQEVLSATDITVYCGADTIDWESLVAVQEKLLERICGQFHELFTTDPALKTLPTFLPVRGSKALNLPYQSSPAEIPDLVETALWHRGKQASDPKDKIYSLVGLTKARDDVNFVIDYSQPVRQVYIDFVNYAVRTTGKLDVLCAMPRSSGVHDLPSWVPDWSTWIVEEGYLATLLPVKYTDGTRQLSPRTVLSASGALDAVCQIAINEGILTSRVVCIDLVDTVTEKCVFLEWMDVRRMARTFHSWYQFLRERKGDHAIYQEAFCRTFICGMGRKIGPDGNPRDDPNLLRELFAAFLRLARNLHPDLEFDAHLNAIADASQAPENWAKDWGIDAGGFASHRRFFISNSGILGLGPTSMKEGDKICVIQGCCVPVILRQMGDYYIFVDQAYIDGYMFGRAVEEVDKGLLIWEDFEIR